MVENIFGTSKVICSRAELGSYSMIFFHSCTFYSYRTGPREFPVGTDSYLITLKKRPHRWIIGAWTHNPCYQEEHLTPWATEYCYDGRRVYQPSHALKKLTKRGRRKNKNWMPLTQKCCDRDSSSAVPCLRTTDHICIICCSCTRSFCQLQLI